jgi:hypothetical protein
LHKNYGGDYTVSELATSPPSSSSSSSSSSGGGTGIGGEVIGVDNHCSSNNILATPLPRLARLTQFITFMPKKFRTNKVLIRKAQAVIDGVCNNHWAALAFRVPIKPFPAWSEAAKAIKVHVPRFDDMKEETEEEEEQQEAIGDAAAAAAEGEANLDITSTADTIIKKRARGGDGKGEKKKSSSSNPLHCLPADILSLL